MGGTRWRMPLAVMGRPTGDGRMFDPHVVTHLALPQPFRYVAEDAGGHQQSRVVGTINKIDYSEADGAPIGTGVFFDSEDAPAATRAAAEEAVYLVDKKVIGPSVDLDSHESEARQYTPKQTVGEASAALACGCGETHQTQKVMAVTRARMRGATLVAIPAFAELAGHAILARAPGSGGDPNVEAALADVEELSGPEVAQFVTLAEAALELSSAESAPDFAVDESVGGGVDRAKIDDSDFIDPRGRRFPIVTPKDVRDAVSSYGRAKPLIPMATFRDRLMAIAKRKGPEFLAALPDSWDSLSASLLAAATATADADLLARPPAAWFDNPKLDGPTPLTITPEGRVYGHLATWGTCHTGFSDSCVKPPKTRTGYAYFHTGAMLTAEGREVPVGRLTYGGGHARPHAGYAAAAAHYDSTSAVGAYVRAGEDGHGIWVAGAMSPEAGDTAYRTMRAAPLSGDWRDVAGNLELVAALHVNTAGFPIPRAVVASGHQVSLIAAGALEPSLPLADGALVDPDRLREIVAMAVTDYRQREALSASVAHAAQELRTELVQLEWLAMATEAKAAQAELVAALSDWGGE